METLHASWPVSRQALVLHPERSRALTRWWLALHGLLVCTLAALAAPLPVTSVVAAALLLHAAVRFPRRPPGLEHRPDGTWALPELGLAGLRAGRGSRYASSWVRLVLVGPGFRRPVILHQDQLPPERWRALQATLRRSSPLPCA